MADETGVPGVEPTTEEVAFTMGALQDKLDQANNYYDKVMKQITELKDKTMAEVLNPSGMMMSGGGDGLFGGGGSGLIGGLILGSLLRNNGGFLGGEGAGAAALARIPPEQSTANMQLMQSIGAVDKAVAVSTATMEASQATQTLGITTQLSSIAAALTNNINQLNTNLMATANETQKVVMNDGDKTRALITNQYEMNLQRQLADANAAIIELRGDNRLAERTRGIEVTTTNNINQMQQQQQQQSRDSQLYNAIWGLGQSIRDTNSAINVGSGTQTSTNTPTNTNIR
jgi:hypothetical protein